MKLNTIKPTTGSKTSRVRVGRGGGSGMGKTAGRGHKGQTARSGGYHKVGFEGGQMPIQRRLPKRGFVSQMNHHHVEVRLSDLERISVTEIDLASLKKAGVIPNHAESAKLIKSGTLTRAVTVQGIGVTRGAREAVTAAGGRIAE